MEVDTAYDSIEFPSVPLIAAVLFAGILLMQKMALTAKEIGFNE